MYKERNSCQSPVRLEWHITTPPSLFAVVSQLSPITLPCPFHGPVCLFHCRIFPPSSNIVMDQTDALFSLPGHRWESFWALNTGYTIFPAYRPPYAPIYPPTPLPPALLFKISTLPPGFQALTHSRNSKLALDVLDVISRTSDAHHEQALHGTIVQQSDVFRSTPRRYRDFWEACTCLGAPDECVEMEDGNEVMQPNLQKLIVLAVLLYCLHTFSPMRAVTAVYNGSRMKLTTDVPRRVKQITPPTAGREDVGTALQNETDIEAEEDVLLWIHFVLLDSWRAANDKLLPQGVEVLGKLRRRLPERVARWEICEAVLMRFFWNEGFVGRCRAFWGWGMEGG